MKTVTVNEHTKWYREPQKTSQKRGCMSWLSRAEEGGPRQAGGAFADSRCREIEDRYRGAEHPRAL